ncbi:WD40 repeat domain-containing protein [Streptomyces anulatus]|uniref:WD40 repeat domain-containing protein n=1 Tax=Streptomyces anulatus TaxID=1892 RepID=UPI00332BA48A
MPPISALPTDGGSVAGSPPAVTVPLSDSSEDRPTALIGHTRAVFSVAFSPDGETLGTGSRDSHVRAWSTVMPRPSWRGWSGVFLDDGLAGARGSWWSDRRGVLYARAKVGWWSADDEAEDGL